MSFSNLSIKAKLLINTCFFLAVILIVTGYSLNVMNQIGEELVAIAEEDLPTIEALTKVTEHQLEQAIMFERALRYGGLMGTEETALAHFKETVSKFEDLNEKVNREIGEAEVISAKGLANAHTDVDRKEFAHVIEELKKIESEHKDYAQHVSNVFVLYTQGNKQQADILAEKVELEEAQLNTEIEELLNEIEKFTGEAALRAEQHEQGAIKVFFILAIIAVIFGLVANWLLVRMITAPVNLAAEGMKYIAQGDLTRKLDVGARDEIGDMVTDMNAMNDSLVQIVSEVRETSESIASGSRQISAGNANLSQRTEEQASSLEETASSMEEMTSTVQQNAESAQEANTLAATAQQQAAKGGEVVQRTIIAMEDINTSSARIADIITTIDSIAFQTNLLALNAAVEAARAGEQGRGFAVVASEVRTLAQRSADAAKEIKTLIVDSVDKVKAGSALVSESGTTLTDINEDINKVANIIAEIASASSEQAAGIEQVNTAITQMDDMTQQNAALVEEAAAASRSMEQQAHNLSDLMSFFKMNSGSGNPVQQHTRSSEEKTAAQETAKPTLIKRTGTGNEAWENF